MVQGPDVDQLERRQPGIRRLRQTNVAGGAGAGAAFLIVATAAFALLWLAGALLLVRVVVGPSLADRVVALDGLLIVVICGLAGFAG